MTRKERIDLAARDAYATEDYRQAFRDGAEWAERDLLDRACRWLEDLDDICLMVQRKAGGKDVGGE